MLAQKPQNLPKTTSYAKMNQKEKGKKKERKWGEKYALLGIAKEGWQGFQTHPLEFAWDYPVCPNDFIDFW